MEALLVYSLVLVFFIVLALFVSTILRTHPYKEPESSAAATASPSAGEKSSAVAYIVLAAMFLLFCLITVLDKRGKNVTPDYRT